MTDSHKIHRCSICDRTNSKEVILIGEQYTPGPFRTYGNEDICFDCDDSIYDSLLLWEPEEDEEEEIEDDED